MNALTNDSGESAKINKAFTCTNKPMHLLWKVVLRFLPSHLIMQRRLLFSYDLYWFQLLLANKNYWASHFNVVFDTLHNNKPIFTYVLPFSLPCFHFVFWQKLHIYFKIVNCLLHKYLYRHNSHFSI